MRFVLRLVVEHKLANQWQRIRITSHPWVLRQWSVLNIQVNFEYSRWFGSCGLLESGGLCSLAREGQAGPRQHAGLPRLTKLRQIALFSLPWSGRKLCVKKARETAPGRAHSPRWPLSPRRDGSKRGSESRWADLRFWTHKLCKEWVSGPRLHFSLPGSASLRLTWLSHLYN